MRRSLLALFRSADGNALARALAVLMFVASVAGQFPLGLHGASASSAPVICSIAPDSSAPAAPAAPEHPACCIAVCAGSATTLASGAPSLPLPAYAQAPPPLPPAVEIAATSPIVAPSGPRGPPFLA